jgi:hypothetical protein
MATFSFTPNLQPFYKPFANPPLFAVTCAGRRRTRS